MRRLMVGGLVAVVVALPTIVYAGEGDLTVVVSPAAASFDLGSDIELTVAVTNNSDNEMIDLAVHLDITDPTKDGSVDPEDWVPTLTLPIRSLAPAETRVLQWRLKPIAGGQFSVYAVVLQAGSSELYASEAAVYSIAERRALNPQGILQAAIGMPVLIGSILLGRMRAHRRKTVG